MNTIGALAVLLSGQTQNFENSFAMAERTLTSFGKKVGDIGQKMTSMGTSLSLKVTAPIVGFATASVYAFSQQEKALLGLRTALEKTGNTGVVVDTLMKRFEGFAKSIQKTTVYSDDMVISQMAVAKRLGVQTSMLESVARSAMGLSAKFGMDLPQAMMFLIRASQNSTMHLKKYGITIDENLTPQQKFNELLRIGLGYFDVTSKNASTTEGRIMQLKNSWNSFLVAIGEFLVKGTAVFSILEKMKTVIEDLTARWENMSDAQKKNALGIAVGAAALGPMLITFGQIAGVVVNLTNLFIKLGAGMTYLKSINLASSMSKLKGAFGVVGAGLAGWMAGRFIASWTIAGKTIEDHLAGWFGIFGEKIEKGPEFIAGQLARQQRADMGLAKGIQTDKDRTGIGFGVDEGDGFDMAAEQAKKMEEAMKSFKETQFQIAMDNALVEEQLLLIGEKKLTIEKEMTDGIAAREKLNSSSLTLTLAEQKVLAKAQRDEVEVLKLKEEILKLDAQSNKLVSDRIFTTEQLANDLGNTIIDNMMKQADSGQKLLLIKEKMWRVEQEIAKARTDDDKIKKTQELVNLNNEYIDAQRTLIDEAMSPRFGGAVLKGTTEAYTADVTMKARQENLAKLATNGDIQIDFLSKIGLTLTDIKALLTVGVEPDLELLESI